MNDVIRCEVGYCLEKDILSTSKLTQKETKMKKIFKILLLTIMVFNTAAFAKDTKSGLESLEKTLKVYKQLNLDANLEKTIDYVYPPVFKITPKEQLLAGFKIAKESGKMPKINAFDATIRKPLKSYEKGTYTLIDYTMGMTMNMMPPVKKENKAEYAKVQKMLNDPKELASYKSFMMQMLKTSMGKDAEIKSENDSMVVDIKKHSMMIAIDEDKSGWKFVEPTPAMIGTLKKVLPKEIVTNEKKIFDVKVLTPEEQMAAMMEMMKNAKDNK